MGKGKKTEPKLITATELARELGVSETAVRKAVKSGRIVPASVDAKGKRWFIFDVAKRQWGKNTLPEKPTGRQTVELPNDFDLPVDLPISELNPNDLDQNQVKKLIGVAQARILTSRAEEMEQKLVGVEDVACLWERHIGEARRMLLAVPAELRLYIPVLTNEDQRFIEEKIAAIMKRLMNWNPKESTRE